MSTPAANDLGRAGEDAAASHLERLGYTILDRNFRTRWGELDIVAARGPTLCFCEVKARRVQSARFDTPFAAITANKQARVRKMSLSWLAEHSERPWARELRFDAIGVAFDRAGELLALDHIEGAF